MYAEEVFKDQCKIRGITCTKSSLTDDKYHHIDFTTSIGTVDVKSATTGFTGELVNNWGYEGSLRGAQEYMVYVTNIDILFVPRLILLKLVEYHVNKYIRTHSIYPIPSSNLVEYYVPYRRNTWKDIFVYVPECDITPLVTLRWTINEI